MKPVNKNKERSFAKLTDFTFLGISIVGQSNRGGDGGIYVGSIMKGGAVQLDGRIEPGDMILQVNDINFENMTNDEAVKVLREVVQKPGPVKLVVAKCWDPNPKGKKYFHHRACLHLIHFSRLFYDSTFRAGAAYRSWSMACSHSSPEVLRKPRNRFWSINSHKTAAS